MIEKPLIIIIVCYIASFSFLGVQLTVGDIIGVDMRTFDTDTGSYSGDEIRDSINGMSNEEGTPYSQLSNGTYIMTQITLGDESSVIDSPIATAAGIAFTIFQLMTGTYIFDMLVFLGVPVIFVGGIVMIYIILLSRTVIAYVRGI